MYDNDSIITTDETLTPDECSELINIFKRHTAGDWDQSKTVNLATISKIEDQHTLKHAINFIHAHACNIVKKTLYVEHVDLTLYSDDCGKSLHFDNSRNSTALASISYLSENFKGGETVFMGLVVKPKIGTTLFFDGKKYLHGIKKVQDGERYALAIWYSQNMNDNVL